jgi:hypothetical protein
LRWQEVLGEAVTLATFDRELWNAGAAAGLRVWPRSASRPDLAYG